MDWQTPIRELIADGLTVDGIALEMRVTPSAVREVLSGRTKAPRASAALALIELCKKRGTPQPGDASTSEAA